MQKKVLYDAPIAHSSSQLKELYPELSNLPAYYQLIDMERRMFERIEKLNPSKVFMEGVPKGKRANESSKFDEHTGKYLKNLHKKGAAIEGMENMCLFDLQLRIGVAEKNIISRFYSYLNGSNGTTFFSYIKSIPLMYAAYAADEIISGARTYTMARNAISSLDGDTTVLIHGKHHNLKRMIKFLGRNIEVVPVDENIEKEVDVLLKKFKEEIKETWEK